MNEEYSIGLDIGTSSVGWAVINPTTYEIIKKNAKTNYYNLNTNKEKTKMKKKALWGVRLFEEAQTAEERRKARSTRRRYDRRRKRIELLQNEFREEINKVDSLFFEKLKDSFYSPNDKNNHKEELTDYDKENIFSNNRTIDKNNKVIYLKKYPTIYHLRNELINNPEKKDIRLVYLAIHHIIKYRGNFLYENDNFKVNSIDIKNKLKEVFELINDKLFEINIDFVDYNKLENAIFEQSKNDAKVNLKLVLKEIIDDSKKINELINLLIGNKFNLLIIFNQEKEEDIIEKISFKGNEFDDNYDKLVNQLGDNFDILNELKELYDMIFLKKIFKGSNATTISELMIEKYDKHKKDLKELKKLLKENSKEYKRIFKTNKKEKCIYDKYIDNNIEYADFRNELKKSLEKIKNIDIVNNINEELTNETFMPRITSTDNGKYPYQFNKTELIKIIENQSKYYPFLKEKIDDKYKIEKLLEFRIPYYVGPLNTQTCNKNIKNSNAWLVKKEEYKDISITPYNFEQVIDKEKTAREFIERMIGNCTYINNEKAMPNNSIFYSRYKVISEIKQISVNKQKFTKQQILDIYYNLFLKNEKVTKEMLESYLRQHKDFSMINDFDISGFQGENKFVSNMKSYIDFFGPNGIFYNTEYKEIDAEEIIKDITIFEDKDLLKSKIIREYPELDENKVNIICKLKYKGWSSLSRKLLEEIYYIDKETNEKKNIMDLLFETDKNFMQILNDKKYHLQEEINKLNKIEIKDKVSYDLVKELATSPKNKRGIYQALKIVEEIINFMGYEPQSISIEMARGNEKKERKLSRKDQLIKKYEAIKEQLEDYNLSKDEYNELNKEMKEIDENEIDEKVFLYFIQLGRSLYSREKLYLSNISEYEVDHILPQSLIKDDSIENKALVLKKENQEKRDSLVVPEEYRKKNYKWWEYLKKCNLITNKKFFALTRKEFTEEQIEGFINRQLVETRQITKHVANILNNYYKKTKIIYLHANLSHNYREKFELFKYRDLNDYHHAHDAYLAACLGIYQDKYINKNINFNQLKELSKELYENKNYKELNYGYIINSLDNSVRNVNQITGEVFDNNEFNKKIEYNLYRNDIIISKKTEIRTGEFYKQTIYAKGSIKAKYRIKESLPIEIYGGYSNMNYSYMILIKTNEKLKLLGIPIQLCMSKEKDNLINKYIKENLKTETYEIIKDKIPFNQKMIYKNQMTEITGCGNSAEVVNATELKFNKEFQKKYKHLLNFIFNNKYPEYTNKDISYIEHKEKWEQEFDSQINILFEKIIDKINEKYPLYNDFYNKLLVVKQSGEFNEIQLKNSNNYKEKQISKVQVIKEILKLLKCDSGNADLSLLDKNVKFSDRIGRKSSVNIDHAKLITQSVTGLKEQIYEF